MNVFWDIPYTFSPITHPLHRFDLFVPHRPPQRPVAPLICFVHGGAWRSEDKEEYSDLARSLAVHTSFPVVVPNYQLTKPDHKVQHPAHAQDILQLLTFLLSWSGPPECQVIPYDPHRIFLMGHSCSAHMLASILLKSLETSLVPSSALLQAVKGVIFSEGIYDIDTLLHSFPTYRDWFIVNTFGDLPTYAQYSVTKAPLRDGTNHIRWILIHSRGDTLVDKRQSQAIVEKLGGSR
ncbi:Alpha/Beta hydrolase protein [Multifurca ochricompacta]|uniref:Alpha/Beta hydrolase protein n=1 Tax=Multifurca ochricompacta TaxID=376703 RepID=A0AAD4QP58_9AGAM|nr:Alpha/Beta hydrolase protein [Multifurca ochricompacta]